ncbi:hypothetical protein [Cellulosimicrobium cellulans]|uniref:hypothetical protein n=1 Tax=Cellulosimicrobium cellulans TaxID=1710 RepID=UPI00130DE5CB|nr:hypothetical protein [Cellulosimicrobium cellulans]
MNVTPNAFGHYLDPDPPAEPAPGDAGRLRTWALRLAVGAALSSTLLSAIVALTLAPVDEHAIATAPTWSVVAVLGTLAVQVAATLAGIAALVLGATAAVRRRGGREVAVALVVAALAPFVSLGVFLVLV